MRNLHLFLGLILGLAGCGNPASDPLENKGAAPDGMVRLFPENPRYLEYKGKPVILLTSAEHYGALVNLDFDFSTYLQALHQEGFNYTRIFAGTYFEPDNNIFGIQNNTLAPGPGRYISPWLKVDGKYDLDQFNPDYFKRLRDFMQQAEKLDIIVELTLFSSIYSQKTWELLPFHPANNSNQTEVDDYRRVHTLYHGSLQKYQEKFIRKVIRELNDFGNMFYEIQNEPWADNSNLAAYVNQDDSISYSRSWQKRVELANDVALEWQEWVAGVISDEESSLKYQHLIAQNISNFKHKQAQLPEHVSIINFHYATPDAVEMNLDLGGVIGLDETGFMPQEDQLYIKQAWKFILAGGGLYNNLDYSFTAKYPDGTWPIASTNPGWGGPLFRKKLSYLVKAMEEIPFYTMKPSKLIFKETQTKMLQYGLMREGDLYLVYLENPDGSDLIPDIPSATYTCTWLNPMTGELKQEQHALDGTSSLRSPFNEQDVVIKIELELP